MRAFERHEEVGPCVFRGFRSASATAVRCLTLISRDANSVTPPTTVWDGSMSSSQTSSDAFQLIQPVTPREADVAAVVHANYKNRL